MPVGCSYKTDSIYRIADGNYGLLLLKNTIMWWGLGLGLVFSWWVICALGIQAWNPSHTSCRTPRAVSPGVWNALRLTCPPRSCYCTHWPITETQLALESSGWLYLLLYNHQVVRKNYQQFLPLARDLLLSSVISQKDVCALPSSLWTCVKTSPPCTIPGGGYASSPTSGTRKLTSN